LKPARRDPPVACRSLLRFAARAAPRPGRSTLSRWGRAPLPNPQCCSSMDPSWRRGDWCQSPPSILLLLAAPPPGALRPASSQSALASVANRFHGSPSETSASVRPRVEAGRRERSETRALQRAARSRAIRQGRVKTTGRRARRRPRRLSSSPCGGDRLHRCLAPLPRPQYLPQETWNGRPGPGTVPAQTPTHPVAPLGWPLARGVRRPSLQGPPLRMPFQRPASCSPVDR